MSYMSVEEWRKKKGKQGTSQSSATESTTKTSPTSEKTNYGSSGYMSVEEWRNKKKTGASTTTGYKSKSAEDGWNKYLADQKKKKEAEENKPWYEKLGEWLGQASDTTLPTATTTTVINNYRNDTSYREPTDKWSDSQRNEFGSLYNQSPTKAYEYAKKVNNSIAQAEDEKQTAAVKAKALSNPVGHTAGAILTAPLGLADYLDNLAEYNARGEVTEKPGLTPFDYSQTVTSSIGENLNEKHGTLDEDIPIIGGKGWGDVYGLGTSIAQSALAGYTGGQMGTLVQFFGSAATSGFDDAKQRGASDQQALQIGALSGIAEGLAESIGIDNLLKIGSATTMRGLVKNVVKQGAAEGLEEGFTTLLNNFADQWVMKDKSNFYAIVNQLVNSGVPLEQAKKQAWLMMANDLAFDMVGGFVSGTVHAGSQTAFQTAIENVYQPYKTGKYIMESEGSVDALKQLANDIAGASSADMQKTITDQVAKVDNKQSALQVGKLYNTVQSANNLANASANQADIAKSLERNGFTAHEAKAAAEAIIAKYNGQELTDAQKKTIKSIKGNSDVQDAITNIINNSKSTMGQRSDNIRNFNRDVNFGRVAKANGISVEDAKKIAEGKFITAKENAPESHYKVSTDGQTIDKDGNAVTIQGIASLENGRMVLQTEGGAVNAGDVTYGSQAEALVYEAVSNLEGIIDTDTANRLSKHLMKLGEVNSDVYARGIVQAYTYGYYGYGREAMLGKNTLSATLTEKQRNVAYGLGEQFSKAKTEADQANARTATIQKKAQTSKDTAPDGTKYQKVVFDSKVKKWGKKQKAEVAYIDFVASNFSGNTVHVFESYKTKDGYFYEDSNGKIKAAPNGMYIAETGDIYLDLNAGNHGEGLVMNTFAHELYHHIQKQSPEKARKLAEFLVQELGYESVELAVRRQIAKAEAAGHGVEYLMKTEGLSRNAAERMVYDRAFNDFVADSLETMFTEGDAVGKLQKLKSQDEGLFNMIKDFIDKWVKKLREFYNSHSTISIEGDMVRQLEKFDQIQQMFVEALVDAGENYQASITATESQTLTEAGIGFDEETKSVYSLRYSTAYIDKIQVGKERFDTEAIAQIVAKGTGRSIEDARKWVESEMTIANLVMANAEFLDFEADSRYEAIKKNSDYPQGTVDLSNLCPKREEFTTMFDMLQKKYPDKLFTAQDIADMRKILAKNHITVACGACFVEDRRQLIGEIADTFIGMWTEAVETGKPLQKTNAAGKKVELLVTKALAKQYGLTPSSKIMATGTYIPNQYDLTTYEGFKLLEKNHPTIAMAFNRYNNSRGQQSARLIEGRAEYDRQILGWSDKKVKTVNNNGGLRIFSFSDFEVVHLLDLVQVIIDCSARGVKIQGYTKIPAFAKLVRNTGIKLNRSLIPKGDYGFHMENGKVVLDYDNTEGININDENFLDESDNPNVGNILIGINPTQISAAFLDPFIDYIIPFHSNKAKAILKKLGTGEWVNYKESQHEKDISTGTASKHNVNIYTQVINKYHPTNKVEFVEAFLKECKRQGKIPRYAEFLNVDENGDYTYREGYHKLLVDFKMFDNDGNILPQGNIVPNMEESFMKELLAAEVDKKQNYQFPQEVYDDIDKQFGEQTLYSDREDIVDVNGVEYDHVVELDYKVFNRVKRSGKAYIDFIRNNLIKQKITVYDNNGDPEVIEFAGEKERVLKDGAKNKHPVIGELTQAKNETKKLVILNAVETAEISRFVGVNNEHKHQWLDENGWEERTSHVMTKDGIIYPVTLHIARARDGRNILYDVNVKLNEGIAADKIATSMRAKQQAKQAVRTTKPSADKVSQQNPEVKMFSDRDNAPTFYSQMGKVIEGMKQEKFGASSVVSMLRGKGVKAEEVKWSGIEEWLEGKKSVTKAELQEFIAGSMLQIEEETLTNDEIPYTEDQQKRIAEHTANRDEIAQMLADEWKEITGDEFPIRNVGAGLESAVVNKIIDTNKEHKDASFEGRLLKKLRNDLKEVIANNDDFGFDSGREALISIHRHRRSFIDHYEMSTKDKAVIVKYCNALNAYNELPKKISDVDADKLRTIANDVDVFNRKIGDVKSEHYAENAKHMTKWGQYKIKGGENYREILFKIPGSHYYNDAMAMHWEERDGVLAHARIQDLNTFLGRMLFVEEIQSDWHNEGHKEGYNSDKEAALKKIADLRNQWNSLYNEMLEAGATEARAISERMDAIDTERANLAKKVRYGDFVPDAPFKDTYHEYVLKRLLREAAENDYDSIGWTPAEIQVKRWSEKFAEGYRIEYDQDIPKFLNKYGKKWGTKVGKTVLDNGTEVWSMAITDEMKDSVLTEGQPLYSDRDTESISNRSLLANAFEGMAQNDIERNKIQEYKSKIDLIEAEERKLQELNQKIKELSFSKGPKDTKAIRDLQFEAKQTSNRINTYDKQLLRLEASKPLQDVIAREKKVAYQKAEKKGKEAMAAYKEKAAKTQRELLNKYQDARKTAVENREKTAMRHKIQNVVKELNDLLLNESKKRHVPDNLKKAVADALSLVNMDTVGAEERAAKYAALIAKETDPDKIDAYTVTMENILRQGDKMGQRLKELRDAYEEIQESDDPDIANAYDPVIAGALKELSGSIGNTSLRNMNIEQLSDVYDMYKMVLTRVRDANKTLLENIKENISSLASRVIGEVRMTGGDHKYRAAVLDPVRKFLWNNLKPVYAMEHIGSSTLTKVFNNVRAGEDTWAKDVTEAREYYLDKAKKYGYNSWDFKKKYRFQSASELEFELTLEQILSLYAYSKREQAHDHLRLGGFVFDSNIETYKDKDSKILKYKVNTADAHQITPEILATIIGNLSDNQKAFVDEMQDYLSTVMGAKGNEVTMKMYGVKLFKEKFYFPLKSAKQFMFEQNEVSGEVKIKNSGFTNKVVAKANNPVILSNFMDVWSGHVNDMSMYHSFVLPLEDFNRVFNYNSPKKENQPSVSVKGTIQNAYSPAAVNYVKNLIADLNGGARTDSTTGIFNKMMGLFKKGAVFASLSVVVQQPSAIARAVALVDAKYFIGPKVDHKRHKALWDEVKQYAPVAVVKEMGYFDTNMGKSTQDFILGQEYSSFKEKMKALVTDSGYRDEVLSKAPALADEIAWCSIWEAVKRETKAQHKGLDVKSEPFLMLAGSRFTEVITKTQVYDSVLSRSANMRSKDTGMKMATAFMAEPTTSINMIADALLQGKRGNKKYARAAIGAVIASQILNSILVSFVYAGRDDDEDESYWEKYIGTLSGEIIDSLNPAGYIPFIKDIQSIVQGYDVERSDMAVISDLVNAYQKLGSDNLSVYRKVEGFAGSIAQIFGLPVKNIMRDVRGIYQTIDSLMNGPKTTKAGIGYAVKSAAPKWMGGGDVSDHNQLYEAYLNGDKEQISRVEGRYKDKSAINTAVRKALRENDPRIHEAAIAWNANDLDDYMRIAKEIIAEKHFGQDDVVMAIRAEAEKLKPDEASSTTAKAKGLFTAEKFAEAIAQGDSAMANAVKTDIVKTEQKNGKTVDEATKSFNSSAKSELKEMYLAGKISEQKVIKALTTYCGADENSAKADVQYWEFKQKYPNVYADDSWFDAYYEDVADSGMDIGLYMEYRNIVKGITGEGKKERRMDAIHSMPISNAQKDALYYAEGWAASRIGEAPWH